MDPAFQELIESDSDLKKLFSLLLDDQRFKKAFERAPIHERIFTGGKKQISVAFFVGAILRPSILGSLLWFPIASPYRFAWFVRGLFLYYFDDYLSVHELQPWLDSVNAVKVFLITLASIRLVGFLWYCLRIVLRLLWSLGFIWGSGVIYMAIVLLANFPLNWMQKLMEVVLERILQAGRALHRLRFELESKFQQTRRVVSSFAPIEYLIRKLVELSNWWRFMGTEDFLHRRECPLRSDTEIRLLRLPRRLPFTAVRAELISINVQDNRHFECISYCWGQNPNWTHPLLLNNHKLLIPTNVYMILHRRSSFFKEKLLWIDSICINQKDSKEKSKQVRMMKDIYSRGIRVSICLGDAVDSRRALSMISWLANMHMGTPKIYWEHLLQDSLTRKNTDKAVASDWAALCALLRHDWFERIWIVQEIACSPWATVLYGSNQITWRDLLLAIKVLTDDSCNKYLGAVFNGSDDGTPRTIPKGIIHAGFIESCKDNTYNPEPIYKLLRRFQAFKATQGVDKIFAMLGLSRERTTLNNFVDYQRHETDILRTIAKFFLHNNDLLEVLHLAGIGWESGRPKNMPSWAVDWTISREPAPLAHPFSGEMYQASGNRSAHIRPCVGTQTVTTPWQSPVETSISRLVEVSDFSSLYGSDIISIRGLTIATVREILPGGVPAGNLESLSTGNHGPVAFRQVVQSLDRMEQCVQRWLPSGYYNGQSAQEALWRTVCGDRTWTERPIPQRLIRHLKRISQAICATYNWYVNSGNRIPVQNAIPPELQSVFQDAEDQLAFIEAIQRSPPLIGGVDYIRTICITENSYLALVPHLTDPGDIICLLYGAQVPFVLRPWKTRDGMKYRLVGECYVHGMMDGEGLHLNKPDIDFEIF